MVVYQGGEVGVGEDEIGLGEEDALPLDAGLLQPSWSTVSIDKYLIIKIIPNIDI